MNIIKKYQECDVQAEKITELVIRKSYTEGVDFLPSSKSSDRLLENTLQMVGETRIRLIRINHTLYIEFDS